LRKASVYRLSVDLPTSWHLVSSLSRFTPPKGSCSTRFLISFQGGGCPFFHVYERLNIFFNVYERAQYFLHNDPDLQNIVNDFSPEMFTTTGIEVLGTPIDTDDYIKNFVGENCIKIMKDVEKFDPLTDAFTHFQLIKMTQNTRTQYMSGNISLPPQEQFLSRQFFCLFIMNRESES
jgi:hypothetical protein